MKGFSPAFFFPYRFPSPNQLVGYGPANSFQDAFLDVTAPVFVMGCWKVLLFDGLNEPIRNNNKRTATRETATRETATRETATRETATRETATRETATRETRECHLGHCVQRDDEDDILMPPNLETTREREPTFIVALLLTTVVGHIEGTSSRTFTEDTLLQFFKDAKLYSPPFLFWLFVTLH